MRQLLGSAPATVLALIVGTLIYLASLFLNVEIFEYLHVFLLEMEHLEIDELLLIILMLLVASLIDLHNAYARRLEAEKIARVKLHTLQTTMRTVQDIVGNSLNNLLLFKIEAEKSNALDEKHLQDLDNLIYGTSEKINKLANITVVVEKPAGDAMYFIDLEEDEEKGD
ncbi:MAG: hypothetical protein MJA83_03480 [Gammaproteobacteria bacterium]|nr:hypothetical protein [Gammaproteobacteria bacterium]